MEDINIKPPTFCQYSGGKCNQSSSDELASEAFFIYPSQPTILASTIYETVKKLNQYGSKLKWLSWEELNVEGSVVFCKICKAIRFTKLIVANITTANFNVYFELGYAIGLKKPILPIRDITFEEHKTIIEEIGVFDTIGYLIFNSSRELVSSISSKKTYLPIVHSHVEIKRNQPIFYLKSHIDTDGSIRLTSSLKKSYFRFISFDPRETSRLSFHEIYKNVMNSVTVIAHLMDPARKDAQIHNARAAFVCGLALSAGKNVLMLQEGSTIQPIDYRDIIRNYTSSTEIPSIIGDAIKNTAEAMQSIQDAQVPLPKGLLERIDLGDVAAENETQSLSSYFVKTPQFQQARQGHARLVIGRKGAGKTALFYGIRNQFLPNKNFLTIDLKPEGHQFSMLREKVIKELSYGVQLHTITAFWHFLLLLEIAKKLISQLQRSAYETHEGVKAYIKLTSTYDKYADLEGDFSERLMKLTNRLIAEYDEEKGENQNFTGTIYYHEITELHSVINENIKKIESIWILFDNLDKGFPTHGIEKEDILLIRCLLESTRKIQKAFGKNDIVCSAIVFIRRDVYELLIEETPDRGKESMVSLDWSDTELIKELISRRIKFQAPELVGKFEDIWSRLFDLHVSNENSFQYILDRTFLRPRDVLNYVRKCMQVSISRNHERVETNDIIKAEEDFSEDMLNELRYEIRDIFPSLKDPILLFYGAKVLLSFDDIAIILVDAGCDEKEIKKVIDILLWFSFLGISLNDDEHYAYQFQYNINKQKTLLRELNTSTNIYCIHPAFRKSLKLL